MSKKLKSVCCVLSAGLLWSAALASGAEVLDLTTQLPVSSYELTPLPVSQGPYKVLWDLSHGVFLEYEPTGAFSNLAALLSVEGFTITTITAGIDNTDLSDYDVLVICLGSAHSSAYTASEVAAAEQFVSNGGGLLVMGDNTDTPNGNINPISQAFGATCGNSDFLPWELYFTRFAVHSIFSGVEILRYDTGGEVLGTAPSVEVAWADDGRATIMVMPCCRVIVTGDINFCDNNGITRADNETFTANVFHCLAAGGPSAIEGDTWGSVKSLYR